MGQIARQAEKTDRVAVIGAGIGGLVAAAILAKSGFDVTVIEKADRPGGKMRTVEVSGRAIDAGPTVFTMRRLFDEIAREAGFSLDDALTLKPVETLARHAWGPDERLDLFVDPARSADAIGDFSGAEEAKRFLAFHAEAAHVFRTLENSFIRAAEPSRTRLVLGAGLRGLADLARIKPFASLWSTLGGMFADPRLRQLFGRYATYCGSSPFDAPATLMLVAHVEMDGVWLVEGGMTKVAQAFEAAARANGATFRYGAEAAAIEVEGGRVSGVTLAGGERIVAGAVVFNGDSNALASGLLGPAPSRAAPRTKPAERSLSATTFCRVARTDGFPLARHTVFFSDAYEAEFSDIFAHSRLPERPTVYVCAQDRDDAGRLGPPTDDARPFTSPRRGEVDAALAAAGEGDQSSPDRPRPPHPALRADLSPLGRGVESLPSPVMPGAAGYSRLGGETDPNEVVDTRKSGHDGAGGSSETLNLSGPERLMLLVNAPAIGDAYHFGHGETARCERNAIELMEACGLAIGPSETVTTTPSDFAAMFPGTGGALYGPASHGANASFRRATAKTALKGLYLAGGSVHPGPGIPMAALSGWQAAKSLISDSRSTGRSRPEAMPGTISTPGATTAPMG